jgi:hypothetical protein
VIKFHTILEVKLSKDECVKSGRKQKFDYILLEDTGYNNIYLKVCINYHIYLSHRVCLFC